MATFVTVSSLKKNYQDYLQSQDSSINPYGTNTFYDIDAGAMALFQLDLYMNLLTIQNSIYPQNAQGTAVDQWLYTRGLQARSGLTYGTIIADITAITGNPTITEIDIPDGTVFTDTNGIGNNIVTNNQYQSLIDYTDAEVGTSLSLYALTAGSGYVEPLDNYLTASIAIGGNTYIVKIQVTSSTNGQTQESDQSCVNRILQSIREPLAGAKQSDYAVYALAADSQVTDSIILPSFVQVNDVSILGVFPLVGTAITEYQLNQGLTSYGSGAFTQYSREADSIVTDTVNNYIQAQKLVTLPIKTGPCLTKEIFTNLAPLNIEVALATGYTSDTLVTVDSQDQDDNPITLNLTVDDLIRKYARKAICDQPYGGVLIGSTLYVTMDSILYGLSALSYLNGTIAQILVNAKISNSDQVGGTQTIDNISYIFDIEDYYNSIEITYQA